METEAQTGEVTSPKSYSSIGTARLVNPISGPCPCLHSGLWTCFSAEEISPSQEATFWPIVLGLGA